MSYLVFIENFCVWYYDLFSNCFIIILCYLPFTQWQNRQIPVALHIIFFYIKNWHIKRQDSKVCYQIVAWTYPISVWRKSASPLHRPLFIKPAMVNHLLHKSFTPPSPSPWYQKFIKKSIFHFVLHFQKSKLYFEKTKAYFF